MKQFNLEEFKKNPSQKVVTRKGNPAKIIYTNAEGRFPIVALVLNKEGNEHPFSYTKYGLWSDNGESSLDLFFEPIKKEGWINIYKSFCDFKIYKTKEEAEKIAKGYPDYTKTIKIEWEE